MAVQVGGALPIDLLAVSVNETEEANMVGAMAKLQRDRATGGKLRGVTGGIHPSGSELVPKPGRKQTVGDDDLRAAT